MTAPSNANTSELAPTDALRLVPCPFCGGDVINTRSQEMTEGPAYYWHKCETCGAESEGDYGEDVAVAAWNRRAAPASPLPGGLPPISLDGPHEIDFHRQWLARQLLDSKLDDEEAYSIVRHDPAIRLPAAPTGEPK